MPNNTHLNLTAGAEVTVSVSSNSFQPQLALYRPDTSFYDQVCGNHTPLTADSTPYTSDITSLTADATELVQQVAAITFTVPVSGMWLAVIGSCDGGCGSYHFTVSCS